MAGKEGTPSVLPGDSGGTAPDSHRLPLHASDWPQDPITRPNRQSTEVTEGLVTRRARGAAAEELWDRPAQQRPGSGRFVASVLGPHRARPLPFGGMRRTKSPAAPPPVPFSPAAARAHRAGLGLTPEQVAEGMAAHGVRLLPAHILAWESGELCPSEPEFIALARALWCPAAHLMDTRPVRLRDHRVACELGQAVVAERTGTTLAAYQQAELTGHWDGDEDQTHALADVLHLSLPDLVEATGRREALDHLLRQCVAGRWQPHLRALARIVPAPDDTLAAVLTTLHQEHHVPTHWGTTARATSPPTTDSLTSRFWHHLAAETV